MVDARGDSKTQTHLRNRPEAGKGPGPGRPNYTRGDTQHFEKLSDFSHVRAAVDAAAPEFPATASASAFQYTENDGRAFEKLMAFVDGHKGTGRSAGRSNQTASGNTGYSESDNRLFDEMMSSDRYHGSITPESSARDQRPPASAVQYSQQDLQSFHRLMPDQLPGEGRQAGAGKQPRSKPDRDVGHIRIVDFDKEHAREKESRKRGNMNITIRYFD